MDDTEGVEYDERLRQTQEEREAARRHLAATRRRWTRIHGLADAAATIRTDNHIAARLRAAFEVASEEEHP